MIYQVNKKKISNGEIIAYRETGKDLKEKEPTLILIHGNQSSSLFYEHLMKDFEDRAYIVAIDMAGFGESTYKNSHIKIKDWADDVALFMDEMKISNGVVVGWSAGGGTALELAANYRDKVNHLVLLASVGVNGFLLPKRTEDLTPIDGEFLYKREDVIKDPAIMIPITRAIENKNTAFLHNIWGNTIFNLYPPNEEDFNAYMKEIIKERCFVDISVALCQFNITHEKKVVEGSGKISDIVCPVTWIHGKKDLVVPFFTGEESIEYFEREKILIPIEDAGHASFMDQPELFNEILENIINKQRRKL
ncbi:alpha/beta fold hydrolase [Peptoniphilus porci]|uniref:AB hydrolase-1 domain-containing protein n=1 Tax=Peptoniphilus porci TaxID=2652280 RepID=A0A1U7M0K2_9FIRM|nr:alpha/beta hydrolase [Peptoniphilus porci]OLR65107.1 hypothetical protein BIV18_06065 [Peptoniphilus porci]